MERYFDAFLHVANWGTHWLMLRLPRELMRLGDVGDYLLEDGIQGWQTAEHLVLSFRSETDEPEWEEGSGWLSSLIGARAALIRGDRRSLYLGWLAQAWAGSLDDTAREPPVPPGLGELDATHLALADFLRIPRSIPFPRAFASFGNRMAASRPSFVVSMRRGCSIKVSGSTWRATTGRALPGPDQADRPDGEACGPGCGSGGEGPRGP